MSHSGVSVRMMSQKWSKCENKRKGFAWIITWGCIVVDQQCRGSNGKVKIEGYMSISDEEAHQHGHWFHNINGLDINIDRNTICVTCIWIWLNNRFVFFCCWCSCLASIWCLCKENNTDTWGSYTHFHAHHLPPHCPHHHPQHMPFSCWLNVKLTVQENHIQKKARERFP